MKQTQAKKFWQVRAAANDSNVGEVLIYGPISDMSLFGDEVTPKQFRSDLEALGNIDRLDIFINSPGGNVFASQAIYSILKRREEEVVATVDGIAASGASLIAMAADRVIMPKNAMMMVHNPHAFAMGDASVMRKMADSLEQIGKSMVAAYAEKTGLSDEEITAIMDAETWFTAEEAIDQGFADEIEAAKEIAASIQGDKLVVNGYEFDASQFQKAPPVPIAARTMEPTPEPQPNISSKGDRSKRPVALFERRLRVQRQRQMQKEMTMT